METIAAIFARNRLAVAAGVVLLTALAVYGVTQLKFDDDPRNIFRTHQANFDLLEEQFADFGSDDNDCVFVLEGEDLFSPAAVAAVRKLVGELEQVDRVDRVVSIFDARRASGIGDYPVPIMPKEDDAPVRFERAKERALAHPLVAGQLLSEDAKTMLVIVKLVGSSVELSPMEPAIARFHELAGEFNQQPGLRARLTGIPTVRVEVIRQIERDLVKFNVLGAVLAVGIAYIVFRQVSAVLLVVAAPAVGALWVLSALGLAGVSINVLNAVVPTLVLVVGLTDSVHFVLDIRRSRAAHVGELDASMAAISHVGTACGLTSITSAIGFSSLVVARADIIRGFGLACAAGSIITFLAVMMIVPLLASTWLGRRLGEHREGEGMAAGWANAIVRLSAAYPRSIAAAGIAITLLLGAVTLQLRPDSWLTENLPKHNEASQALAHCDEALGGVLFIYAIVEWPEGQSVSSPPVHEALQEIHALFASNPHARNPLSVLNVAQAISPEGTPWPTAVRTMQRAGESLRGLLRTDKRRALVSAHIPDKGAAHGVVAVKELERGLAEIEARHEGLKLQLSGSMVVASGNITTMIGDLGSSLGLESLVIFALMSWSFRSLWLGLISIVPNVFPLVCVAALMVALGMPLQFGSVIVFNICLGLAVDDTIHVMTRFNRELETTHDVCAAILRSFSLVGTAVLTTTFILLAGFGVVTLSDIPALRLFGSLACVTILAALVGELIFTPALLQTFLSRKYAALAQKRDDWQLTPAEWTVLSQEQPGFPQTNFVRLVVTGQFKRTALQSALVEALSRHPLLNARVERAAGAARWVPLDDSQPRLLWLRGNETHGLPTAGLIDLETERGLRGWVIEAEGNSELVFELHRACCNARGAIGFATDVLSAYADQLGDCSTQSAPELPQAVLADRWNKAAVNGKERKPHSSKAERDIVTLATVSGEPPRDVADDFPAILSVSLDGEKLPLMDASDANSSGSREALLRQALFAALTDWLAGHRPASRGWLRVASSSDLPTGEIWFERGLTGTEASLARVPTSEAFGPVTARLSFLPTILEAVPLPRQQQQVVAGNVVLERMELAEPLRSGMPAALVAIEYAGELTITLHYDSRSLSRSAASDLLRSFEQRVVRLAAAADAPASRSL